MGTTRLLVKNGDFLTSPKGYVCVSGSRVIKAQTPPEVTDIAVGGTGMGAGHDIRSAYTDLPTDVPLLQEQRLAPPVQ